LAFATVAGVLFAASLAWVLVVRPWEADRGGGAILFITDGPAPGLVERAPGVWVREDPAAIPEDAAAFARRDDDGGRQSPGVWLFARDGTPLGVIETGVSFAGAVWRASAGELLVAYHDAGGGRLSAYSSADLGPLWSMPLPGLGEAHVLLALIELSADESTLFYAAAHWRETPECKAPGAHGPSCTTYALGIASLDGSGAVREVPLPNGCGLARLQARATGDVLVTCGFEVLLLPSVDAIEVGRIVDAAILYDAVPRSDGSLLAVDRNSVRLVQDGRLEAPLPLLAGGAEPIFQSSFARAGNLLVIPYADADRQFRGVVVLDVEELAVVLNLAAPEPAAPEYVHVAVSGGALWMQVGTNIYVSSLAGGAPRPVGSVDTETAFLIR
jgi:hypothetical protein